MARSEFIQPYNGDAEKARAVAENYLNMENFKLVDYKGEKVYKLGTGMAQAMQFLTLNYGANEIKIEAWVCAGVASATMKEMNLKGFLGMMPKKLLKKRVKALMAELNSAVGK